MGVALLNALFNLDGVRRAEVRYKAALAADKAHHLALGVLAGVAQRHDVLHRRAAEALGREHPLVVADAVDHTAIDE